MLLGTVSPDFGPANPSSNSSLCIAMEGASVMVSLEGAVKQLKNLKKGDIVAAYGEVKVMLHRKVLESLLTTFLHKPRD